MNILFFLTPKSEVAFVPARATLSQALYMMEESRYTAVPILDDKGRYIGVLTEGDLLRYIKDHHQLNLKTAEDILVEKLPRRVDYAPVNVECSMEELVEASMRQNFVPVTDDSNVFIGLILRRHIIEHLYRQSKK